MIRILHTADWQLGKPFGRIPSEVRAVLTDARFDAIDHIAEVAKTREIVHVLVAGDIFDNIDPGDRVVLQALSRMERAECQWWLMPGNHDHARAGGLWARIRARAAANIHVVDVPAPIELQEGAWLLPAPLDYRRTREDPTEAMSSMDTPAGAIRIGLAHGSVVDFAARGDADNLIPPNRAELSRLDYLALGDWHSHLLVNGRTTYSGTPEPDSFSHEAVGCVVVAEVCRGSAPSVEVVETGRFRWVSRTWRLASPDDYRREVAALLAACVPTATLLALKIEGSLSLSDATAVRSELANDVAHRLRWLSVEDRLSVAATEDDISGIGMQGSLAVAASMLREMTSGSEPGAAVASKAIERLYVEALRARQETGA